MITLEAQGPINEIELFIDALCYFRFVKTYSQTYKNIEKTKSLVVMEVGVPTYLLSILTDKEVDDKDRFVTEEMLSR